MKLFFLLLLASLLSAQSFDIEKASVRTSYENITLAKLSLGVNADFLSLGSAKNHIDVDTISTQKFNFRLTHQRYFYSDTLTTHQENRDDVDMLGVKIDWFVTENFYVTGQAFGAYNGGAGGYAVGMFGVGYVQPLFDNLSGVAEVTLGASGGGGIRSGDGLITQPMAGFMYKINHKFGVELMAGKVLAINGALNSTVLDFSIVYKFGKLVAR